MTRRLLILPLCVAVLAAGGGCRRKPAPPPKAEAPVIPIARPVEREVTDSVDYTGQTAARDAVEVRARVTGFLLTTDFTEGKEVKKGDPLFEIDPSPYKAQVDQADAQMRLGRTQYDLARANYARAQAEAAKASGSISEEQLQTYKAQAEQAAAAVRLYAANLASAQLYLDWCTVKSPIDGRTSRFDVTPGNLITADQTRLTTIVSLDPMYAYFDMDSRTLQRVLTAITRGDIKAPSKEQQLPVLMGLEGEEGFPHTGTVNFVNNQLNPSTGTLSVRGDFANPLPPWWSPAAGSGVRLMRPGMFVRIRLPIGQQHTAQLVIDRAIGSDQGLKFVYVVGDDDVVQYRRVRTGALQPDGLRVLEPYRVVEGRPEGVRPGEWVVVGGLLQVRPRARIETERVPMPTLGGEAAAGGDRPPPTGNAEGRQGGQGGAARQGGGR
jgi:multidrug efflux system membrane fusion protein